MINSHIVMRYCVTLLLCVASSLAHANEETKPLQLQEPIAQKVVSETPNPDEKFLDIQSIHTDQGIKAWLVEDPSLPVIAMKLTFRNAGAKTDPQAKQGRARLAANTMDEGAGELSSHDFQKELRDQAITLYFSATRDDFEGTLKTLSVNKERAFTLLKHAVNTPRFDPEPVERMRAANKTRIKTSLAKPRWMAARIQNDRIFEGHPYALNSGGTISTLDNITIKDLKNFHRRLSKENLIVSVAGDITAKELATALNDIFGDLPDLTMPTTQETPITNAGKTYLYQQDIPQTVIEIAQSGIKRNDEKFYAAQVMSFILGESGFGSRLMEEIREKRGLTYGIYSYFREYDNAAVLHVSTSTVNETVPEMLSLIKAEWHKMKSDTVSAKELSEAKSYLIGSLPLSLTSTDAIAGMLSFLQRQNLPIDYLDKRAEKIESVTATDIKHIAQKMLNTENFVTILVGNPPQEAHFEIIKTLPNTE